MAMDEKPGAPETSTPVEPPAEPIVEYPRWLYHKDGNRRIVQTADEATALGEDWSTTPPKTEP